MTIARAARLEANPAVIDQIKQQRGATPAPPFGLAVGHLFGVPIVADDSLPAAGWRLLDDAGQVIHESHPTPTGFITTTSPRRRWWHRFTRRSAR